MAEKMSLDDYSKAADALMARARAAGYTVEPIVGISLGGCAEALNTERKGAFRRIAHSHNNKRDPLFGWLCVLSGKPEKLVSATGRPTALFAHEYAHLIARDGHGRRWQAAVTALGHSKEAKR